MLREQEDGNYNLTNWTKDNVGKENINLLYSGVKELKRRISQDTLPRNFRNYLDEEKSDIQKYIQQLPENIDYSHPLLFENNGYIYTFNTNLNLYAENRKDGDGFEILYKDDLNKLTNEQRYDI